MDTKRQLEQEIEQDFLESLQGIKKLKKPVRLGVYLVYNYYMYLLREIKKARPEEILKKRYRLTNTKKSYLFINAYFKNSLNLL